MSETLPTKICPGCGVCKPRTEQFFRRKKGKGWRQCRKCEKAYLREHRKEYDKRPHRRHQLRMAQRRRMLDSIRKQRQESNVKSWHQERKLRLLRSLLAGAGVVNPLRMEYVLGVAQMALDQGIRRGHYFDENWEGWNEQERNALKFLNGIIGVARSAACRGISFS